MVAGEVLILFLFFVVLLQRRVRVRLTKEDDEEAVVQEEALLLLFWLIVVRVAFVALLLCFLYKYRIAFCCAGIAHDGIFLLIRTHAPEGNSISVRFDPAIIILLLLLLLLHVLVFGE